MDKYAMNKMDIYGPADCWDVLPDGSTVGTTEQFVAFSVGYSGENLLTADEAEALAFFLMGAAKKSKTA